MTKTTADKLTEGTQFKLDFVEGTMTAKKVRVYTEGRFAGKVIVDLYDDAKGAYFQKYYSHNHPVYLV